MNLVMDDAEEVYLKKDSRRPIGEQCGGGASTTVPCCWHAL